MPRLPPEATPKENISRARRSAVVLAFMTAAALLGLAIGGDPRRDPLGPPHL
jgi:hypothetical protein